MGGGGNKRKIAENEEGGRERKSLKEVEECVPVSSEPHVSSGHLLHYIESFALINMLLQRHMVCIFIHSECLCVCVCLHMLEC